MPKSQRKVSCDDVCAHSFEWKTYGKIYKGICCTQI
jgi:hypothetical protein